MSVGESADAAATASLPVAGVRRVVHDPAVTAAPHATAGADHVARLERAAERIAGGGDRGLVLLPGPNLRYFTGLSMEPSERLTAAILGASGARRLVVPAFERDRVTGEIDPSFDVVPWAEAADPFGLVAGLLDAEGWLLDPGAPFWTAEAFRERGLRLRSGGAVCAGLRRRKDAVELQLLAAAQRMTRETLTRMQGWLEPGVTEADVAGRILATFRQAGVDGWAIVQFGAGSALPHGRPGGRPLQEESAVLVDLGAIHEGYHADLTRAWWFGSRPDPMYGEVADAVEAAQARAASLARPGAIAGDLDRAAREHLELRDLARHFVHRLGHGVGLEIHEPPFLVEGSATALEVGDVLTIEPGVYLPGRFGIRHEDLWVVEEEGSRRL